MKIVDIEDRMQKNLAYLAETAIGRHVYFAEVNEITRSMFRCDYYEMARVATNSAGFSAEMRELSGLPSIESRITEKLLEFSSTVETGISQALNAYKTWIHEELPTGIMKTMEKLIQSYREEKQYERKERIRDILAFRCYARAQLVLQNHSTEFAELMEDLQIKEWYENKKPFRIKVPRVSKLCSNVINTIGNLTRTNPRYDEIVPSKVLFYQ